MSMHAPAEQARGKRFLACTPTCHRLRKVLVREAKMNLQNDELKKTVEAKSSLTIKP
jgi:hypothetical protein